MTIPGPKTPPDSEDHILECEFVAEPEFQALAERLEAAGWSAETVALALAGLAAARIEAIEADSDMLAEIRARRQEH